MLAAPNSGTLVVSTLSVTLPLPPPPVRSDPAVTPVIVPFPVPGKVCPAANVICPLLAMFRPVSAALLVPEANSRFNVPEGVAVLLLAGSACHWNVCVTAFPVLLLNDEAAWFRGCEFLPLED